MKDYSFIEKSLKRIEDIETEYFPQIESTNLYLSEKIFTHKYHLCFTDIQTSGKGRRGSKWVSSGKDNIYATLASKVRINLEKLPVVSLLIAVSVVKAIESFINEDLRKFLKVKLPNDIYFKDKKIAGILIETKNITRDSFDIIIGVGINVNIDSLEEEIDRDWTSIYLINNKEVNSSRLLVALISNLMNSLNQEINILEILKSFEKYDYTFGNLISFNDGEDVYKGIAKGINKDMQLILEMSRGTLMVDIAKINKLKVLDESN